jgi:adenylate cyclase
MAGGIFKTKWRLKPSILTLFLVLTLPVFGAIVVTTYLANDSIARESANRLLERFRVDAIEGIQSTFDPIKTLARSTAELGKEYPDFYLDNRPLGFFHSMLLHSDKIVSVYVGLEDGSFRQVRRVDPAVPIQGKLPPAGAPYAYRWIDPRKDQPLLDHYRFVDLDVRERGYTSGPTTYDPRTRGWYRDTIEAGATRITPPDVFATLGLIGFTVAAPFSSNGKTGGVAAIDITLDGFSAYLSERKISPNTLSYILDSQGRVIANSDLSRTYAADRGRVELRHVSALDNELAAMAFANRPRQPGVHQYSFTNRGKDYVASLSTLPAELGTPWQLFVVTPLADFTQGFEASNNRLLLFGLVILALQVAVIYYLSSVLSRPLENLARKVAQIQQLGGDTPPSPPSAIREIAVLGRAIDTLDTAVKSFASYVPVGLVRQLLDSEQKLELGGHSRFLTIFFSDLQAFSTLSESIPSQELLARVSAYLEAVNRAVNQEHGTIDKFLGDGVMAFWGAPALLEDHAWRACVAALRIQRSMKELNARWAGEGFQPLKPRIGIHCDAVVVGNIGSKERMSYTVMGDGVNVAARLEGINKEYGTGICISHSVYKEAGERLVVRPLGDVSVKGRRSAIPIYELLAVTGSEPEFAPDEAMLKLSRLSRAAHDALVEGNKEMARQRLAEIVAAFPDDHVSRHQLKRLAA